MEFIIFGAGETGAKALGFLGFLRVKCFVDNDINKEEFCGKEVIGFDIFKQMDLTEYIIVIASEKYWTYMERQLLSISLTRYFVFRETDPVIWNQIMPNYTFNRQYEMVSYNRLLAFRKVEKYKRIAILGTNILLPYLISEIAIRSDYKNVVEIISDIKYEAKHCMGIPIVPWEMADKNIDCLIVNMRRNQVNLNDVLDKLTDETTIIDIYDVDCMEPLFYRPELVKYKDIYKGKRIFLIGNGPSLRIEDLEKLHRNKEICIACNKIYRIYDKTEWRADYIAMSDYKIISDCTEEIPQIPGKIIMADNYHYFSDNPYFDSVEYIHYFLGGEYPLYPRFSEDVCNGVYCGLSVMYDIGLQLAAYMGASEIYLIGIDHSYTTNIVDKNNHFIKDYYREGEEKKYASIKFEKEKIDKAYETAEGYSRKHGFRIYNATRGGALEVFERVDFDSLF